MHDYLIFQFSILTFGIGNLINDGPLDPFNLQRDLDDAQNQLNSAQQQLNEANQRLWQLNSTHSSLGMRNSAQEQLRAQLPELENNAEAAKRNCATIEQRFVELKESSSKLLVKVREIQDGAVVTEALAYSKKEYAAGLLEICLDCLIDRRVFDEAEMVKKEVIEEYGGEIPDEIAEMGVSLDLKLKDLGWTGA
jgi:chromosome segregation ATPase